MLNIAFIVPLCYFVCYFESLFFLIFLPINTLLWLKHIYAEHFAEHCASIIKIRENVEAKFCDFFELNEILFCPHIVYDKFTYTAYIFLTVYRLDSGNCVPRTPFKMNFLPFFSSSFSQILYLMCVKCPVICSRPSDRLIWNFIDPF